MTMYIDNEIKSKARRILQDFNITKVTLESLIFIIEQQGFELVEYSQSDFSDSVWSLMEKLNLRTYAETGKAFAYKCGRSKLVFICAEMSADEKLYALAHEEGHIACGHLCNGACNSNAVEEEYIANEFAHYLLNPPLCVKIGVFLSNHNKVVVVTVLFALLVALAIPIVLQLVRNQTYYGEYYISENGERYHEKDCMIIRYKRNIHRLTEKDFYSNKYEPCQVCLPD